MGHLQYTTRDNSSPQGKPKVYLTCHPEDAKRYVADIAFDITRAQDCAVWHLEDPREERDEAFRSDLLQMQLLVIVVTTRLLTAPSPAMETDFRFAIAHNIPVLPIMCEPGLEPRFNQLCGNLQLLSKHNPDKTIDHYGLKLRAYLASVLMGDDLAARIRGAFEGYIFLSYRKKDRVHARELMTRIHRHDRCRYMAVWYDEFLIPGERFDDAIQAAINESDLFMLMITPNVVNEDNYVVDIEYPLAKKLGKPILPVETVPTDRVTLARQLTDLPPILSVEDDAGLSAAFARTMDGVAPRQWEDTPERRYLIGQAYLHGVDVEVDRRQGQALIQQAAKDHYKEAVDALYNMYVRGHYFERNRPAAARLMRGAAQTYRRQFRKTGDMVFAEQYMDCMITVCKQLAEEKRATRCRRWLKPCYRLFTRTIAGRMEETAAADMQYTLEDILYTVHRQQKRYKAARDCCLRMTDILTQREELSPPVQHKLFWQRQHLAQLEMDQQHYREALQGYLDTVEAVLQAAERLQVDKDQWGWLGIVYRDVALCCRAMHRFELMEQYFHRSVESVEGAMEKGLPLWPESRLALAANYVDLAEMKEREGDPVAALPFYEKVTDAVLPLYHAGGCDDALHYLATSFERRGDIEKDNGNGHFARYLYREARSFVSGVHRHYGEVLELKQLLLEKDVDVQHVLKLQMQIIRKTIRHPKDRRYKQARTLANDYLEAYNARTMAARRRQ